MAKTKMTEGKFLKKDRGNVQITIKGLSSKPLSDGEKNNTRKWW